MARPDLHHVNRKLSAIMFTDIVGFSRQMGSNEARMLRLLDVHNHIIQHAVLEHHGHVIKTIGDAFLVDFPSVVHAVQGAQQILTQLRIHNAEQDKTEQIHVRIGIHLGDVVQRDGDVFGDGVNIASRLQSLAEPDTICLSQKVYEEVAKKIDLGTVVALGKPKLKNITERFHIYALLPETPRGLRQQLQVQRLKLKPFSASLATAGLLLVGGILALLLFRIPHSTVRNPEALPLPDKPSIVVLPFDNMSKDPEQDYFSNGITEVLTSDLSRIASLFVIARNTAFTYKGKAVNVRDVGKELGVRYVLEGSVQKANDQVRIVAQLIDTVTGAHLWSERYDRPLKDIFALQDEIVQKIVTTLKLQLMVQEQGYSVRKHTDNLEAYDTFLHGVEAFSRYAKEAVTVQARQMFERAIELDPRYAEAYAWLGRTYTMEWASRWNVNLQTLEHGFALEQKAVALDASLPLAHSVLSFVYAQKQQYDQALAEGERAITLDPNNADSYAWQASVLNSAGRPEEALRLVGQAMRLNPRHPPFDLFVVTTAYYLTGRYAEAIATAKEFLSRSPNYVGPHLYLALSYVSQWAAQQNLDAQTLEQALAAAQRVLALNESDPLGHVPLGYVYLWQKQYEQSIAELERSITLASDVIWGYVFLAETLSRVGKPQEALGMIEQALRRKPAIVDHHLVYVGAAYYFAGRPEEAVTALRQFLTRYPNILGAHLTLAAVYSELGREAEAQAEAAEVLRLNPLFSLEVHKERAPIKDPAILERHIAALHKAGLK